MSFSTSVISVSVRVAIFAVALVCAGQSGLSFSHSRRSNTPSVCKRVLSTAPHGKIDVKKTEEMVLRYQKMDAASVEAKRLLEEIILRQSRLAYFLTIKYLKRFKDRDQDDLFMVGLSKVERAVELFRLDGGSNFNSYCRTWIEGGLRRELQNEFWESGLADGSKSRLLFGRLPRVLRSLEQSFPGVDGHFTASQIVERYNLLFPSQGQVAVNEKEVERFLMNLRALRTVSLEAPFSLDTSLALEDTVESSSDTPESMEHAAESIRIGRYFS